MTNKLKITTDHIVNPHGHGETLLGENAEVFAEFHNPYRSEHLISNEEAHELQVAAARKMLEQAPVSPEMQSRNNIDFTGGVALIRQQVLAQEREYDPNASLALGDIAKDSYGLAD